MSALLSPNPVLRFYGSDGQPLSGGYLQTLDSETSNPVATYRDAGMTTENPSTIMLDANGEPSDNGVPVGVFLVPDAVYKFKWFDRDMSLVGASDGIVAGGGSGSGTGLVEVIGTAEHINVTHSVVRGVSVYRVDLAPSLVSEIDSLEESVVQLGGEMDALEGIVASKADKVSNATAGNLAALDASGNLTDSGKNATDFATDEQGAKADSAVQGVKVNGTELSKDGNNVVDVPVPTASTDTPLKDGTASAGSSTQWARGDHRHPTDDSREAVSNKAQSINDASTTEYPSSKAVADFVNSSVATNTATFLGNFSLADLSLTYPATEVQIAAALNSHTWPTGYPTNNDYVYVEIRNPQSTIDDKVQRYKYRDRLASWGYEYTLNNSSFTAEEKAAIDSGITSQDVTNLRADHTTLGTHVADTSNPHQVTAAQVGAEPAFSVLPVNKGGTGGTTNKAAAYNIFSDILHITENISDTSEWIQGVGSPSSTLGPFCRNKILNVWVYIQNKISSVLGLTASSYGGNAATATSATTATNYASEGGIADALAGKSSTSHTHSVKINGTTKTIPATGDTAVDLGTYLTSHQSVTDNNPTLAWGATSKVGTVGSTDLRVTMPANPASGKLDTNGDGSNVTAAFTAANTRANISTGDKLSVIFGKIAKWFADLKSVAWSGSYDDLTNKPSLATVATSGSYSDLSNKPTIPSVDQNYNAASTNPQSGTAVAQAVAKSYVATVFSGGSEKSFKSIEFSLAGSSASNCLLGVIEVNIAGYTYQGMFDINAVYTASSHTVGTVVSELCWFKNKINDVKLAYSIDTTTDKLTIYVKNLKSWYSAQIRVLTAQMEGRNNLGYVTMFDNASVTLPDSAVEFTELDSRDASWINSGTFDAARIPTSLPDVTAGYATSATTATNYASEGGISDALAGKSSTSHTHSVKINGTTKTIPATGGTAVDLGTYLTQHQDISGKLDKTGDASNTTATFTKASGDASSMTSGGKLSAIFGAISSFFASLKALAFKDKVSDSDISGTISDSHIASASTWNGKYTKPSTGIPKSDLASAVQTSLGKADSALQSHQDISGKLDSTGDASNTTSTFTKSSGDTSSMTSGTKLSAIFTAISSFFASLKALAFKDIVGTSDIADDAITAAKVKDNETLPVDISGRAAAAGVADLANTANSANSVDWSNVSNKPATIFIGDYGTTTYSKWYSEWSAGKALFCRLSVSGGYVYYALDMIGRQNQDPITFVRAIGQGSGDFVVNGIVCNTDNSYTTIQSHIAGTTGTYTGMTVGASKELYNSSGTKTVACSTDGLAVTDTSGSKSIVAKDGVVSASHGFIGNLNGNSATATSASALIDQRDSTKIVSATSAAQTSQSDYIAVFINNVIAKFAVSKFRAAYAERDVSGNAIESYYLPKGNVVLSASGAIQYSTRIGTTSGNQTLSGTGSSVSVTQNSKIMLDVTINNAGDTNAVLLMEVMAGSTSLSARIFFVNVSQTFAIPFGMIYTGSSTATLTVRWSVQSGSFIGSFYTRWLVIKQ